MKPLFLSPSPRVESVLPLVAEPVLAVGPPGAPSCHINIVGTSHSQQEHLRLLLEECVLISPLPRRFHLSFRPAHDSTAILAPENKAISLLYVSSEHIALEFLARAHTSVPMSPTVVILASPHSPDTARLLRRILNAGAADCLLETDLSAPLLERSIRFALQNLESEARPQPSGPPNVRLGAAFNDTAIAMLMCGHVEDGHPIWWVNPAFERLTGYTSAEARGLHPHFLETKGPTSHKAVSSTGSPMDRALQSEVEHQTTLLCFRRDGTPFWNEMHLNPVRDAATNRVNGWIGHFMDVTERVSNERHLQESRRDLEAAQRLTHLGSWWVVLNERTDIWNAPGFWSDELYRIAGLSPQSASPRLKVWRSLIHPHDRLRVLRALSSLAAPDGPENVRLEHRLSLPDGTEKWVQASAELERDPAGIPLRIVGTILDISESVQGEKRLRAAERCTLAVLQNAPLLLWQLDEGGTITSIQGQSLRIIGRKPEELEGRNIFEVLKDVPKLQNLARRALSGEECEDSEWFHDRFFVVRYAPLPGGGALAVAMDMSETEGVRQRWHESERRYASIVANVPGVVYRFVHENNGNLRFDFISARAREVWGEDFDWGTGDLEPHLERVHQHDRLSLFASIEASAREMTAWEWSGRLLDKNNRWMWVRGNALPWKRGDGAIVWDGLVIDESATRQWQFDLERSRRALEEAQELARMGSFDWDIVNQRMEWSDTMFRLFGYEPKAFSPLHTAILNHVHPNDRETVRTVVHRALENGGDAMLLRINRPDGQERFLQAHTHVEASEDGKPLRLLGSVQDVTEQRLSERALRDSEERYALAARGANDGLWDWNLRTDTIYLSPRWREMIGCPSCAAECPSDTWFSRVHPEDLSALDSTLKAHLHGTSAHFECEYRLMHDDGQWRWMLGRGLAVRDDECKATRIAGSQTDISARKRFESQLAQSAFYDALTGLPNRALFLDRLERALARSSRDEQHSFAVLFLDLDRFKNVNDSLGHLAGDALLVEAGQRFASCLRPGDTVARLGGDEFAILLEGLADSEVIETIATRVGRELEKPFHLEGREVFITVSIGVAPAQTGQTRAVELLRNADTAMYRAKGLGRARHATFDNSMHQSAVRLLELESDLWRALERKELLLHFQPLIELSTGKIHGFEALVRWQHPRRGLVSPGEFIPLAEETGLIVPIGWWVLEEACREAMAFGGNFMMAVNLSSQQFSQSDCMERVRAALDKTGFDAHRLKLEITETVIMQNTESASAMLRELKAMGVKLAMDDFGTGYSSLSYLHRFPLDILKIDRSFIAQMNDHAKTAPVVKTILDLARSLHMDVVAEGVESEEQLRLLRDMNCELAQGFFFARPLPTAQLHELIAQNPHW